MPYEKGMLNSCIQNGIQCDYLLGFQGYYTDEELAEMERLTGIKMERKYKIGVWCRIHNECGRGMCKDYKEKTLEE